MLYTYILIISKVVLVASLVAASLYTAYLKGLSDAHHSN